MAPITVYRVGHAQRALHIMERACGNHLFMRDGDFTKEQITLISTNISLQRGKLPEAAIKAADDWLKRASKKDRRALRALSKGSGAG